MTFSLKRDVELKFLSMCNRVDRIKYKNYGEKKMKKRKKEVMKKNNDIFHMPNYYNN